MKTKIITTMIAGVSAVMMCAPISAAEKTKSAKESETKTESLFEKGKRRS